MLPGPKGQPGQDRTQVHTLPNTYGKRPLSHLDSIYVQAVVALSFEILSDRASSQKPLSTDVVLCLKTASERQC